MSSKLSTCVFALSLVGPLLAQAHDPSFATGAPPGVRHYGVAAEADGQLVGWAGLVSAKFVDDSVVFTAGPVASSGACTLTLTPASVTRGGHEVVRAAGRRVAEHDAARIDYALDGGVTERYIARRDGFKQSFLFAERPAGSGDLAVRLAVDTQLQCAHEQRADELAFAAGDADVLRIATVVGIDAEGRRAAGHMNFDGEHLDLVLPADFVDSATYPLELDPIIGPIINTGVSFDDHHPDVAYDATNDVYLVVFEYRLQGATQIYGHRISGAGVSLGGPFPIRQVPGEHAERPQVAQCDHFDNFCVVWQESNGADANIKTRTVRAVTGAMSTVVNVAATANREVAPDVASNHGGMAVGYVVCVWDDAALGIRSCLLSSHPFVPTASGYHTAAPGADPLNDNPAISKDDRALTRLYVAYESTPQEISVLGIFANALPFGAPTPVWSSPNGVAVGNPDIDGAGDEFRVVFDVDQFGPSTDRNIMSSHGVWTGSAIQATYSAAISSDSFKDEREPCIALNQYVYTVAWSESSANGSDIVSRDWRRDIVAWCGTEEVLSAPGRQFAAPALVATETSGGTDGGAMLCYRNLDTAANDALLQSRLFANSVGGPVTPIAGAPGCGLGGVNAPNGLFAAGNPDFEMTLSGADPTAAFTLFLVDTTGNGPFSLCGGTCGFINPQLVYVVPIVGGAAQFSIPGPCNPNSIGAALNTQWATWSAAPGGCSIFPVHMSNGVRIELGN